GEDPRDPMGEFLLEEPDILRRIMAPGQDRIPFEVGASGRVEHVDEGARLPQVVEELVPQPATFVGLRDQPGDVEHLDGDETRATGARRVVRLAGASELEV